MHESEASTSGYEPHGGQRSLLLVMRVPDAEAGLWVYYVCIYGATLRHACSVLFELASRIQVAVSLRVVTHYPRTRAGHQCVVGSSGKKPEIPRGGFPS